VVVLPCPCSRWLPWWWWCMWWLVRLRQLARGSCGLRQALAVGWTSGDARSFQEGASLRWFSTARPPHAGLIGWWSAAPVCFILFGADLLPLLWSKWFVPGAGAVAVVGVAGRFPGEGSKDLIAFQVWKRGPLCLVAGLSCNFFISLGLSVIVAPTALMEAALLGCLHPALLSFAVSDLCTYLCFAAFSKRL
jgi:hypothetical protein